MVRMRVGIDDRDSMTELGVAQPLINEVAALANSVRDDVLGR